MGAIQNRVVAAAADARLALTPAGNVPNNDGSLASALEGSILPLLGNRWGREVGERVVGKWINERMFRLRSSNFPPLNYLHIRNLFKSPCHWRGKPPLLGTSDHHFRTIGPT